jgi:sugar phosphate isomerase/epimerase
MSGEEPVARLRRVAPDVVHVHCPDRPVPCQDTHVPAAEGLVDYQVVYTRLQEAGYDGWLSVGYNGRAGVAGLRRAIDFARRAWAEVAQGRSGQRPERKMEVQA